MVVGEWWWLVGGGGGEWVSGVVSGWLVGGEW